MGSRVSISNEDDYINDINNINENQLDLSNMDKLQIKAIKQLSKEVKELKDRKSDKIMYRLPAVNLCKEVAKEVAIRGARSALGV